MQNRSLNFSKRVTCQCVVEDLKLQITSLSYSICIVQAFLHAFLVILKQMLRNYYKILKECFLGTSSTKWTAGTISSYLLYPEGLIEVSSIIYTK